VFKNVGFVREILTFIVGRKEMPVKTRLQCHCYPTYWQWRKHLIWGTEKWIFPYITGESLLMKDKLIIVSKFLIHVSFDSAISFLETEMQVLKYFNYLSVGDILYNLLNIRRVRECTTVKTNEKISYNDMKVLRYIFKKEIGQLTFLKCMQSYLLI
jgi:hypothetical protein